jgi:hypothetical protein
MKGHPDGWVQLIVRMPPELREELKILAIRKQTTVQAILLKMARDFVDSNSEKKAA